MVVLDEKLTCPNKKYKDYKSIENSNKLKYIILY